MAEGHATAEGTLLARTGYAVRSTMGRTDARAVFAATTLGYLLIYLFAIGHLRSGASGTAVTVVPNALGRFFQPSLGAFSFEPVAVISVGPVTYLLSFNTILGLGLASLVGLNIALTYMAWRQPKACGIGTRSAGLFAGIPALLSGAACCGPILLIIVGIQATGLLLTTFEFLLPLAGLLLVGSLLLVGRQVQPEAL